MIGTEAATLGPFQYYAEDSVLTPAAGAPTQPLAICLPRDRQFIRVNMHNVYVNGKMPMTSTDFTEATGTAPLYGGDVLTGPNTQTKIVFGNNIPIT